MQSLGGILKRFLPFFKDYIPYFLLAIFGMTLEVVVQHFQLILLNHFWMKFL